MAEPITRTPRKVYLGDGAYVDWDAARQQVKITAENGIEATSAVYLEPSGMTALLHWWSQRHADV